MRWRANAKINLSLEILGRREDGYHELNMVMASVSLCDWLEAEPAPPGISLACSDPSVPCGPQNTVYRAAELFLESSGLAEKTGVRLFLEKTIPSQAGLGGGSADAAATLCALNALFHYPVSREDLLRIGLKVGADVPFCLTGGTQLAAGRGEVLSPLPDMPDCFFLVVKPEFSVSTPELYAALDQEAEVFHPRTEAMEQALRQGELLQVAGYLGNSFEPLVARKHPGLLAIRAMMEDCGALGVAMTGSGSALFGIFDAFDMAAMASMKLMEHHQTFLCRNLKAEEL